MICFVVSVLIWYTFKEQEERVKEDVMKKEVDEPMKKEEEYVTQVMTSRSVPIDIPRQIGWQHWRNEGYVFDDDVNDDDDDDVHCTSILIGFSQASSEDR
uniref:Uncharacterized protein n=1 Tax=Cacopsylla melanoneura TaxID=428564 RepID=A0A8D8Z670_9HEMI